MGVWRSNLILIVMAEWSLLSYRNNEVLMLRGCGKTTKIYSAYLSTDDHSTIWKRRCSPGRHGCWPRSVLGEASKAPRSVMVAEVLSKAHLQSSKYDMVT